MGTGDLNMIPSVYPVDATPHIKNLEQRIALLEHENADLRSTLATQTQEALANVADVREKYEALREQLAPAPERE